MVKFAEAEKRGRGGEGSDRRYTPVVMVERAKMSRAMWESLKAHIIRDRKRKKEEQEADAEEERLRKERETRKKQHAMTLEETREKITQMEQDLNDLKKQKHQLFQELKVVLNEDDTRKRAQQQQNYLKESELMTVHPYPHGTIPLGGHPQMLFQSNLVPGRGPIHSYKVPPSQPQPLVPPGSLKRSRTPSPSPPQPPYQQISYTFKNLPGHPPSSVPVTPPTTKSTSNTSVYVTGQSAYYHGASQPHAPATQYQRGSQGVTYLPPSNPAHPTPSAAPPPTQPQQPPQPREDKHLQPVYLQSSRGSHVSSLHQPLDHKSKPGGGGGAFLPGGEGGAGQEKYFQSSVRSQLALHSAVLPVQQPHPAGAKSGSITSGFPVRSAPLPSSQTTVVTAPHSVKPDNKPRSYSTAPTNYTRSPYY
ncbi:G protein pathway suppressor 2-like isoform X2 [Eriocheir sinensis]|uniref:G protein pathway suppressor 2-like isoform X2 n=1 Tax=Eriocheir sinensis TaxID=95602 RepID=UPI0021C67C79|nr:G protein pathway suppressor 2-like isoform X2 [Eriocheir sinensis]